MKWRAVWARSQIAPVVVSALLWLVILALEPAAAAVVMLLSVVAVAGWNACWALRWRFGARRMSDADRHAILRALVPVQALRGRHQPDLRVSRRLPTAIIAPSHGRLVLGERLIGQARQQQASDEELSRRTVRALGLIEVNSSRLVAAVYLFTLPWLMLAAITAPLRDRVVRVLPVSRFAWSIRWLFIGLAIADLGQRGLWVPLVMLALAAIATVTTPRANRAWTTCLEQLANRVAEHHGFGTLNRAVAAPSMVVRPRGANSSRSFRPLGTRWAR